MAEKDYDKLLENMPDDFRKKFDERDKLGWKKHPGDYRREDGIAFFAMSAMIYEKYKDNNAIEEARDSGELNQFNEYGFGDHTFNQAVYMSILHAEEKLNIPPELRSDAKLDYDKIHKELSQSSKERYDKMSKSRFFFGNVKKEALRFLAGADILQKKYKTHDELDKAVEAGEVLKIQEIKKYRLGGGEIEYAVEQAKIGITKKQASVIPTLNMKNDGR